MRHRHCHPSHHWIGLARKPWRLVWIFALLRMQTFTNDSGPPSGVCAIEGPDRSGDGPPWQASLSLHIPQAKLRPVNPVARSLVRQALNLLDGERALERLETMPFRDEGFGFDRFGLEREALARLAEASGQELSLRPRRQLDLARNARVLADVLDLAELLPHRRRGALTFPPLPPPSP